MSALPDNDSHHTPSPDGRAPAARSASPRADAAHAELRVSRCVCFNVEFSRIKQIAEVTGGGLAEAHRQTGCGARCGLCLPYIQVALKTGQTSLPIMWGTDFTRHGVNPGRVQQIERALSIAHGPMM